MKTKLTLIAIILVALWVLNKVRIIIFGSMWSLVFWFILIAICVWFLSGGISRIPAVRKFIEKYDK